MCLRTLHVIAIAVLLTLFIGGRGRAQDAGASMSPIETHFAHMLHGSGQWRTPNEDAEPADPDAITHYSADYRLSADRSHVIAEVSGVTEDGRRAVFWTIYLFYNPVTQEIVSVQAGWNGALLTGHEPANPDGFEPGEVQTFDQIHHNPDGTMSIHRHDIVVVDPSTHTTQTYDRAEDGSWRPRNFRTWTLVPEE